jgi:hypothetical protein
VRAIAIVVAAALAVANAPITAATSDDCESQTASSSSYTGWVGSDDVAVQSTESTNSADCGGDDDPYDYRQVESKCGTDAASNFCGAIGCGDPDQVGYYVERRLEGSDGPWEAAGTTCQGPDGPTVTPQRVLEALHRIGLPDAKLQTEPGFKSGKTLVNFDTNFYATADSVTETFTPARRGGHRRGVAGDVHLHFDSGEPDQTRTTTTPGAPYPELDVTYAYEDAHTTVHPSVDVAYSAQFSVNGGTWQAIPDTVTITGEPISRYLAEAPGVLTEMN